MRARAVHNDLTATRSYLVLGGIADEALAVGERNVRRRGAVTLGGRGRREGEIAASRGVPAGGIHAMLLSTTPAHLVIGDDLHAVCRSKATTRGGDLSGARGWAGGHAGRAGDLDKASKPKPARLPFCQTPTQLRSEAQGAMHAFGEVGGGGRGMQRRWLPCAANTRPSVLAACVCLHPLTCTWYRDRYR
jgi:hypothetical protein